MFQQWPPCLSNSNWCLTNCPPPLSPQQNRKVYAQLVSFARNGPSSNGSSPGRAQSPRKLYILLLDGDALRMDGAEVGVVEEADEESFGSLLQRLDSLTLPSVGSVLGRYSLGDFSYLCKHTSAPAITPIDSENSPYQSLERRLENEQLG